MSRAAACGPEGGQADAAVCQAAVEAGAALREWDNIRVFGVDGRDRERIPDGELCSGGLSAYRGLDLARSDWPTTELTAGAAFTFRYRATIPHKGTFRLYITRDSYDPARRLTWADLETVPFLRATDPPLREGAYQLRGRLPDRSGRHLVYTVWQNSDSRDTYYSCSDVVLRAADGSTDRAGTPSPGTVDEPTPVAASGGVADGPRTESGFGSPGVPVAAVTDLGADHWRLVGGGGAAAITLLLAVVVAARARRRPAVPAGPPCEVRNHRAGRRREW
ncbi:lytic polysaccharide monooxygenase auxiliary activity family 9 protein [Micromonospora sp. BQ11]|uniref:lytic polysaccharide monooxygenase auxiliary activity family 9 protein n=1 Tax=Micromonospora sp. BQ11 TaxID=3452212 RepID=UPI003F8B4C0B